MPGGFISDEEMAALEVGQSAPVVSAPRSFISDAEMAQIEAVDRSSGDFGVNSTSAQLGKGLTFGWFDEIQGLEKGAQNSLRNLFGVGDGRGFWDTYDATVAPLRATDRAVEEENPWASVGLQAVGGLLPLLASGGMTTAPTMATKAVGLLYGAGTKGAPTALQLAKMGATGGALYGAGEANEGSRLLGAAIGGAVGGIAAPVVGKTIQKGSQGIGDFLANKQLIPDFASETGSLFSGKAAPPPYTPGELLLAKELKDTPIEKVLSGALDIDSAVSRDIPLFLPEALESKNVYRSARHIANYDPSMEFAEDAITARTRGAEARAGDLFSSVSGETSPYQGASRLAKAADDIVKAAEAGREEVAFPLYKAAYKENPEILSPALDDLLSKDKVLQQAINSVRKTANNAELPEKSTQLLVKARQEIGNQIERAKSQGLGRAARDLTDTYNRLNGILHTESPALKAADNAFANASAGIDELSSTFISSLRKETENKVQKVSQIFNLSPERIAGLRQTFIDAGKLDEWNAGIRSYLQNTVESTAEGHNFASKIIGNTAKEAKLSAALGGESEAIGGGAYQKVTEGLNLEDRMFKGKNIYNTGSTTYGNIAEEKTFEKAAGLLSRITDKQTWIDAAVKMFGGGMPEDAAKELAKIYFDPKTGARTINKILPLLKRYAKTKNIAGALGKGSAVGARTATTSALQPRSQTQQSRAQQSRARPPLPAPQKTPSKGKSVPSADFTSDPELSNSRTKRQLSAYKNSSFIDRAMDRAEGIAMDDVKATAPYVISVRSVKQETDLKDIVEKGLIPQESGGNPNAVSEKGAVGLGQLMPKTGEELAKKAGVKYNPKDPEQNKMLSTMYLEELLSKYKGDLELALTAYHSGMGRVDRLLAKNKATTLKEIKHDLGPIGQKYAAQILERLRKSKVIYV
jgi:soluble lytic murein transglycosylase-like protein